MPVPVANPDLRGGGAGRLDPHGDGEVQYAAHVHLHRPAGPGEPQPTEVAREAAGVVDQAVERQVEDVADRVAVVEQTMTGDSRLTCLPADLSLPSVVATTNGTAARRGRPSRSGQLLRPA